MARYTVTDREIDADELAHYWTRYPGGLGPEVTEYDREQIRRDVASHVGEYDVEHDGRRIGSSHTLPGVSPRRRSSGWTTPTDPGIVYSNWAGDVLAD